METTLAKWLEVNELVKYLDVLVSNDINSVELVKSLSEEDLKELGVSLGDRKRFEKAILESDKAYSDFENDVISNYPYVITYPFKRMLDEEDGRNKLELLAYSFLNLMKYVGLILASDYFNLPFKKNNTNIISDQAFIL